MFYSDVENWSFEERGRAFVSVLKEAGHECNWLCWPRSTAFTKGRSQWKRKRSWLAAQLKQAPKPLGLLAASDDHAVEVLETCESIAFSYSVLRSTNNLDLKIPFRPLGKNTESLPPSHLADVAAAASISVIWAVADIDSEVSSDPASFLASTPNGLPRKPVHGVSRNFLFFDMHVGSKKAQPPGPDHY